MKFTWKKTIAIVLSAMMLLGVLAGCGTTSGGDASSDNQNSAVNDSENNMIADDAGEENVQPEGVVVSTAYGDVEVPYAPERICVLDLNTMDIVDALGLGDQVVVLQWHKHYPEYLEAYYNSETIISLSGGNNNHGQSTETTETEEETDPYEMYYGIDADIIIGTTDKITEELYAILSQIAPTVALETVSGQYTEMSANARTIASIWGLTDELENTLAVYDEIYVNLCDVLSGKSYVIANGNTEHSTIQITVSNQKGNTENSTTQTSGKNKDNTAGARAFLEQFGMKNAVENVAEDAYSDAVTAAAEAGTSDEEIAAMVIAAINAAAPDAVLVYNHSYSSLEAIQAEGYDILGLDDLTCGYCFISKELGYTSGGLTAIMTSMDKLADMFLG